MRLLAKIILAIIVNAVALAAAAYFIPDVILTTNVREVTIIAVALTALNFLVKPVLKFLLGPIIILTLGLGLIVVNAVILYILDFLFDALTIHTILGLFWATILVSIFNIVFHFATRK